jgi:hypothetical protein
MLDETAISETSKFLFFTRYVLLTCSYLGGRNGMGCKMFIINSEGRDLSEDLGIGGKIILK